MVQVFIDKGAVCFNKQGDLGHPFLIFSLPAFRTQTTGFVLHGRTHKSGLEQLIAVTVNRDRNALLHNAPPYYILMIFG
ncbi:Uncharacterised protein [Salmonella enterica subsp. arizonae]|uniref:Uncharacterized protein n=1 Tax=Salmonella enterica subsp. arizonae TaxID=59203 RepID=A0A379SUV6_SALER|nr:Uncharacterised protein [Salmonella enterica subsp. arizonae]